MKIALITIHNANNYGSVLQAYATKKILSKYGEVSTIDYDNTFLSHHFDVLRFFPSIHGIKMFIHDILRFPYRIRVLLKFKKFIQFNMNLTSKLTNDELMKGKAGRFDLYVCGSDQIWNPEIVSKKKIIDPIFFLDFAPKGSKKLSYASSIGHYCFTDDEKTQVKGLLEDFSMISTRESDGQKMLSEILLYRKIYHVLDPTMLLSKEEWLKSLDMELSKPKEKYILVYSVPRTELIKKAVEYFEKKLGLKVVAIDQMLLPLTKVDEHIKYAGPKEFIELFANANFIVTDSFHGTCFAVNFGKPFVSVLEGKNSNRIINFLTLMGIKERHVCNENEFENIKLHLDTGKVLKSLNIVRKESNIILFESIQKIFES